MGLKAIVIDDEPFSRQELIYLLGNHQEITVIAEASSAEQGLEQILKFEPNVLFLDIEMTGMNGIELAKTLQKLKQPPVVIFATAYPDYAVKAFRLEAVDYLLKPFDEEQIAETVQRLIQLDNREKVNQSKASAGKLAVQLEDRISYVNPKDIIYIYREGRDSYLVTESGTFTSKLLLKELEQKLSPYSFFRVHKGYIINTEKVEELVSWSTSVYQLKLKNVEEQIPVSRNYVKELRDHLEL
ncbi:LytR/AlgR family response regulator transcription factor [Jeotgalibacillus soli]|uniref:Uncharacterized protein n=1 Tax=Jeotgalibacillus soli TaxID=889306 RepID=A0A0C2W7T4_9BACL|nr:LytTR family DNA-binding domain-containing protein [Jeotgalibacillus soli]KIL52078.1 hypothetical protein KP78_04480 [Jeotgalibacillus soli]